MSEQKRKNQESGELEERRLVRGINIWAVLLLIAVSVVAWSLLTNAGVSTISMTYFNKLVEGKGYDNKPIKDGDGKPLEGSNIEKITLHESEAYGFFKIAPPPGPGTNAEGKLVFPEEGDRLNRKFRLNIPPPDSPDRSRFTQLLESNNVDYTIAPASRWNTLLTALFIGFMLGLLLLMFVTMRRAQNQMMGGGFLSNFSRSPAKRYEASEQPITFKDVAGLEGVKADLQEIVEFLKDPGKFQKLGGRVPKGVLLIGPPGTGKTLLARAVAGEADVPYYSVNGSEFIQMFVGVGASRVRDLFSTAKTNAPAIIFVDEIDAVGRQRGAGLGGGHDEREQTLNQILGEMDGFSKTDSVIILAATNRPDILDPALLRPGRFDRHVTVSRPTLKGRLAIFKVHVRNVPLGDNVELGSLASATAGMTGADIANMVNEAALWAARHDKSIVEMEDFYYAHDKVLMGPQREEILTPKEKERTAFHEAGHTLAAWFLKGDHPVHKVTVIPRGQALGVTQMIPEEDRMNLSENEIRDQLVVLLSGRAAEKLMYNEYTVGAENDLERATSLARRMVTHWGMSERLGPVSFKTSEEDPFLGREIHQNRQFSEHTMEVIDDEVTRILQDAAQKSLNMLGDRSVLLRSLAERLIQDEELDQKEIRSIIGPSVHDERMEKKNGQMEVSESPHADAAETVTANAQEEAGDAS
jgi:cell division protease FtsH